MERYKLGFIKNVVEISFLCGKVCWLIPNHFDAIVQKLYIRYKNVKLTMSSENVKFTTKL